MEWIAKIEQLASVGRYREAVENLEINKRFEGRSAELTRADLYEKMGNSVKAQSSIEAVLSARGLSDAERGRAELIRARLFANIGDFDSERQHLQKSVLYSERARDLPSTCMAQLYLLAQAADRAGLESARSISQEVRKNVTRLGDPVITAALHIFIAEIDGKRGLLTSADNHTRIAQRLLRSHPHLWWESWVHNNLLAIAVLQSDFDTALEHGTKALSCSLECGAVALVRRCLGNLGRLHLMRGHFDVALDHLERARNCSSLPNEQVNGTLDSIARVHLSQNKLEDGIALILEIEAHTQPANGVGRYVHRHSLLTKAELLSRLGRPVESLQSFADVVRLATQAGEESLATEASLHAAEIDVLMGDSKAPRLPLLDYRSSCEAHALYERVAAVALTALGRSDLASIHADRSRRVYRAVQNVPGEIEFERSWVAVQNKVGHVLSEDNHFCSDGGGVAVQSISTLMVHSSRPQLLATELTFLLQHAACVAGAVAIARDPRGQEQRLATFGTLPAGPHVRSFGLGSARQLEFEVRVQPLDDVESQATLNAVSLLLETVRELERAREEREARLTLWPLEQLPSGNDSIVMGTMEELLSQARRIAQTNVVVLITGESGTGKEVVARAIHAFSSRARKAFVPFNCAAIARDLAESQLFGHRRGAFTGADRDVPGLVRSAKDGTLFLDEVGEMALELQPKLLRFLESGEINPLGESSPFNVDVRIIAATNADLDTLVEQGKFREDLFYRLNVVRVTIPPLRERRDEIPALVHHFVAKAAVEFGKERVRVAEETMEQLLLYPWPGNVRQLQNELRRIVALADNDSVLQPASLSKAIRQEPHAEAPANSPDLNVTFSDKLGPTISRIEREMIKAALSANQGKLEAAAKALGISRKGLYLKRQRLGV